MSITAIKQALEALETVWCSWFHGGGDIKRDRQDRINWQCRKCGRWATPVTLKEEAVVIRAAIRARGKP
jgi:hypothetical protein